MNVKTRTIYEICLIIAGIILFAISIAGVIDSFWAGLGAGFIAIGIMRLVQISKYMKDPEYAENLEIRNSDERNRMLAEKSRSRTFYYSIILECIGIIVLRIMDMPDLSSLLGVVAGVQLVIYWVTYVVIRNKY